LLPPEGSSSRSHKAAFYEERPDGRICGEIENVCKSGIGFPICIEKQDAPRVAGEVGKRGNVIYKNCYVRWKTCSKQRLEIYEKTGSEVLRKLEEKWVKRGAGNGEGAWGVCVGVQ